MWTRRTRQATQLLRRFPRGFDLCADSDGRRRAVEDPEQLIEVDGLDQMSVEPGVRRSLAVLLLPVAGDGDDQLVRCARQQPNPSRHLVAVDVGQPDVE